MSIGRPGGGGIVSRIAGWGAALIKSPAEVVILVARYGYVGALREVLSGRREAFQGIRNVDPIAALASNKRAGPGMYVKTEMQLSRAMKADFIVIYRDPGDPRAKTFYRSMLYNKDRSKAALELEFLKRLDADVRTTTTDPAVQNMQIISTTMVGLEQRSDVDYAWEPDDAPW